MAERGRLIFATPHVVARHVALLYSAAGATDVNLQ